MSQTKEDSICLDCGHEDDHKGPGGCCSNCEADNWFNVQDFEDYPHYIEDLCEDHNVSVEELRVMYDERTGPFSSSTDATVVQIKVYSSFDELHELLTITPFL